MLCNPIQAEWSQQCHTFWWSWFFTELLSVTVLYINLHNLWCMCSDLVSQSSMMDKIKTFMHEWVSCIGTHNIIIGQDRYYIVLSKLTSANNHNTCCGYWQNNGISMLRKDFSFELPISFACMLWTWVVITIAHIFSFIFLHNEVIVLYDDYTRKLQWQHLMLSPVNYIWHCIHFMLYSIWNGLCNHSLIYDTNSFQCMQNTMLIIIIWYCLNRTTTLSNCHSDT